MIPNSATLPELRRAVGAWPWRSDLVQATSGKPISEEMSLILALAIFDGFALFPAMSEAAKPQMDLNDCYHPQGVREFDRDSTRGLVKSLNHCHKVNQALIREMGEKDKIIKRLQDSLKWAKLWAQIATVGAGAAWIVLAAVIGLLFERR